MNYLYVCSVLILWFWFGWICIVCGIYDVCFIDNWLSGDYMLGLLFVFVECIRWGEIFSLMGYYSDGWWIFGCNFVVNDVSFSVWFMG